MGDVRIVDATLVDLIAAENEQDVYDAVVEGVHRLLPDGLILVSTLRPDGDSMRVVATSGLDGRLSSIAAIFGLDPTTTTYSLADMPPDLEPSYRSGRLERLPHGVYSLALGRLPRAACAAAERLLGIKAVYTVGFSWGDLHYGVLAHRPPEASGSLRRSDAIETLVHQATIAIRRFRAEARAARSAPTSSNVFFTGEPGPALHRGHQWLLAAALNREWERALGYRVEELEGGRFLDLVHPDDLEATLAAMAASRRGSSRSCSSSIATGPRTAAIAGWSGEPFRAAISIYAAARDLTERIEAEQAIRDSESRYRLIADNTADVIWILDAADDALHLREPVRRAPARLHGRGGHPPVHRRGPHPGVGRGGGRPAAAGDRGSRGRR